MIVEPISLPEANRLLTGAHYLGRTGWNSDFVLSTLERDAVALYRPPVASSFTKALERPLELTRLWRAPDRSAPLTQFLAATLRHIRKTAPEVSVIFSYADESARHSVTGRFHYGGVYRACNFRFLGFSTPTGHWIDESGARVSEQLAQRHLGTKGRAKVAALKPLWRHVPGEPKLLWAYPMAITVEEALAKIAAGAPSGRARYTRVLPPPEPWD